MRISWAEEGAAKELQQSTSQRKSPQKSWQFLRFGTVSPRGSKPWHPKKRQTKSFRVFLVCMSVDALLLSRLGWYACSSQPSRLGANGCSCRRSCQRPRYRETWTKGDAVAWRTKGPGRAGNFFWIDYIGVVFLICVLSLELQVPP